MSIPKIVTDRKITEVMHFTTNRGLVGILASSGVKARRGLQDDEYLKNILHNNAINRPEEAPSFDVSEDWLDYVNLSLSAINQSYMGFSKKWPHNQNIWWYILSFRPDFLDDDGVYFATTNNAYEHCERVAGVNGLQELFRPVVKRKGTWKAVRGGRADYLPTCQQAEVLYPTFLPIKHLQHIYVQADEDGDKARGWLKEFGVPNVGVSVSNEAFRGFPN